VVILAGGCSGDVKAAVRAFEPLWFEACAGQSFILVGGGTASGVSGVAGRTAARSEGRIDAIGYLPGVLPDGVREGEGYGVLVRTAGTAFSPLEPLQAWTDMVAEGVDPRNVTLVAYAGRDITRAECHIALALGARVGLIVDETLPAAHRLDDEALDGAAGLVRLPLQAAALRAFLLAGEPLGES